MGTRGVIGTLRNKVLHAAYQQFDTYPTSTGVDLQKELKSRIEWTVEQEITADDLFTSLAPLVDKMTYVDSSEKPTQEQAEKYAQFLTKGVSTGDDWYAQLREQQGSLMKRLEAGIATDEPGFVKDSLFCEWGYIFDFDEEKVLILRGFNTREDAQWVHARLDPSAVRKKVRESKDYPINDRAIYYGCAVLWTGTMAEFLELDMTAIEALEVDA
jgi:hypothetical protein